MAVDVNKLLLNMPLPPNDAKAATVKDYLKSLLREIWIYEEGFDGKRPFGNSGWQSEIYGPMVKNGFVEGVVDDDGYLVHADEAEAASLILTAIESL